MTKRTLSIVAAAVLAILAGLVLYGNYQHRQYLEAKGAEKLIAAQYQYATVKANIEIAALLASTTAAESQKQAALDAAAAERQLRLQADAERDAAVAKTKALPDDTLSSAINLRIGNGESKPIASGVFSFTRPGTEATLNRFLAGETAASDRDSAIREAANNADGLALCESQRGKLAKEVKLRVNERDLAKIGWDTTADALKHLERSIIGTRIKTFITGAAVGAVAVIALHILKAI